MALLRDALVSEGFEASLTEAFEEKGPEHVLTIGHKGREPSFSLFLGHEAMYRVLGPDGIDRGVAFQNIEEAATLGFEEFGPIPSWELEKYPTIWQYLMAED
jgi:hypothetical protein